MNAFDESMMREALREAESALSAGELPVGCVIAKDGAIVARGHNERETTLDPTAHAEIVALRRAAKALNAWRLNGCTLRSNRVRCARARFRRRVFQGSFTARPTRIRAARAAFIEFRKIRHFRISARRTAERSNPNAAKC